MKSFGFYQTTRCHYPVGGDTSKPLTLELSTYFHISGSQTPDVTTLCASSRRSVRNTKNIDFCSISLTRNNIINRKWGVISLFNPTNSVCHFLSLFRGAYEGLARREEVISGVSDKKNRHVLCTRLEGRVLHMRLRTEEFSYAHIHTHIHTHFTHTHTHIHTHNPVFN